MKNSLNVIQKFQEIKFTGFDPTVKKEFLKRKKNIFITAALNNSSSSGNKNTSMEEQIFIKGLWFDILKAINNREPNFSEIVRKQKGKKKMFENESPTLEECLSYLSQSAENTISLNLSKLKEPWICIDIDLDYVGKKILESACYHNKNFSLLFGNPLVVESETKDHVHLYYKFTVQKRNLPIKFKKGFITRLGFYAEFICDSITFAGLNRKPYIQPGKLEELGELPKALYPYNYFSEYSEDGILMKGAGIPEGYRNNRLFEFL